MKIKMSDTIKWSSPYAMIVMYKYIMNGETTVHYFQKVSEKYLKSIWKYQILFKSIWIQIQILLQNLKSIWIQIPNTQKSICKYQIQVQIPNTVTTL